MFKKAKIKAKIWALARMIYLIIYLVHNDPDLKKVLEHSNIAIGKGVLTINETENDAAEEAAKKAEPAVMADAPEMPEPAAEDSEQNTEE